MTSDKKFADRLISGGGWLAEEPDHDAPDNPQAARIVEYTNQGGVLAYGITFVGERDVYKYERETEFIGSPRVIWTAEGGQS